MEHSCKKCGQCSPVVTFRAHNTGGLRHTCVSCERDDQKERRANPTPTPPKTFREQAPRMEYVRRVEDKEKLELQKQLDLLKSIHPTAPATIEPAPVMEGDAVAGIIISDCHVEEKVDPLKINGLNEYNLDIAGRRFQALFRNALRLTNLFATASKIDTMYLAILGDTFSNYIHEELQESNFLGPSDAANFAMGLLSDGIKFLLDNSQYRLIIDCVAGNHGRMTRKPRMTNTTEVSLEAFMYQALAAQFRGNSRVEFRVAAGRMLYRKFFDMTVRLVHGDEISYGGGVGGITIPIRKKIAGWDKAIRADLTLMGHFHQLINGGDFIVNGSLIGYNEYAQTIGASPEEARQGFFVLHSRKGGQLSTMAPIWLD